MDAWIDCLTSADRPADGMTAVTARAGDVLTLQIEDVVEFRRRCPDQYQALIEAAAFVNWRRLDVGQRPIVPLAFFG